MKRKNMPGVPRRSLSPKSNTLSKFRAPRNSNEYFAMAAEEQDLWRRYLHVVAEVRAERASLTAASRATGLDPDSVPKMVGAALRKNASGHYVATRSDRLLRVLAIPKPEGVHEIATRDSREASRLATYWDYVQIYLQTGDAAGLEQFEGVHITDADGVEVPLMTDLDELDRLGSAGELSFESIYMGVA